MYNTICILCGRIINIALSITTAGALRIRNTNSAIHM
jgi:hypothetical protein